MKSLMSASAFAVVVFALSASAFGAIEDGSDVWYKFTATEAGAYEISLEDIDFDGATLAWFEGTAVEDVINDGVLPKKYAAYAAPVALSLEKDKVNYFRVAGEKKADGTFAEGAFKILLKQAAVDCGSPEIAIETPNVMITCDDFDVAFADLKAAFAGISAKDKCDEDFTGGIRVIQIEVIDPRRGDAQVYTVAQIQEELIDSGKIRDFAGTYEGRISQTVDIFVEYFLFKPATFKITYALENAEDAVQSIAIDDDCAGTLGCYSGCRGCRPSADGKGLKTLLSDMLLIGLSLLVLVSWGVVRRK